MKLLLTSCGIANNSIKESLLELVGKNPEEISLAFIPTASNVEQGDKSWLINDFINVKNLNLKSIHIVDISAIGRDIWEPQLKQADILLFGGGNTFHLMEWLNKSGLKEILPELLKTKVYVGISAGSMVLSQDLLLSITQKLFKEDLEKTKNIEGVGLVDFYLLPHYSNKPSKLRNRETILEATKDISKKIYALDDNSAVEFIDGNIRVITEGEFLEIN